MDQQKKQLMVFGYGLAIICAVIAVRLAIAQKLLFVSAALIVASTVLLCLTALRRDALRQFYGVWMKGAHAIGSVVSGAILCVLFYTVFSFVGIILRLIRKDLLDRTLDHTADTYWIKREPHPERKRYTQQF